MAQSAGGTIRDEAVNYTSPGVVRRRPLRVGACLSLTGRYGLFGTQAAHGLEVWRRLDGDAEVIVEDDGSDAVRLLRCLAEMDRSCDLLLGPYSTELMRAAARLAPQLDRLLWNHGGAGDDVQGACPGRIVSVLAPTSRYAVPFVKHLAQEAPRAPLWIVQGKGSFGRQVAGGAVAAGRGLGLETVSVGPESSLSDVAVPVVWDLFSAGAFEEDAALASRALTLSRPPRALCAVAAGVQEFARAVADHEGIYGIAQWSPGRSGRAPELGPAEAAFMDGYLRLTGTTPDYPAVQAAACAVIAAHCARVTGGSDAEALWRAAASLDTTTLFGPFRIDPSTGVQVGHEAALVRWSGAGLTAVESTPSRWPLLPPEGRRGA